MHNYKSLSVSSRILLTFLMFYSPFSISVVNVDRTRIVFNENDSSKSIMLKNDGDHPLLVQIWTDEGEIDKTPDSIITPVIALPPVSKVFGGELRSIKLIVTSRRHQKKGQETLYWLNIFQSNSTGKDFSSSDSILQLPLRLRLKVFVRPLGLGAPENEDLGKLKLIERNNNLLIENPTAWYMNISKLSILEKDIPQITLPPFSTRILLHDFKIKSDQLAIYMIIDDMGISHQFNTHIHHNSKPF